MKKFFLGCFSFFVLGSFAQELYVEEDITVSPGGVLFSGGNATVAAAGQIDNEGSITLQGDFTNNGTLVTPATAGLYTLNGSAAQALDLGGSTIFNLTLDNSNGVNGANGTLNGTLTFTNGSLDLGATNITFASGASVSGANATNYIITSGTGVAEKVYSGAGNFDFPVGTASEYAPLSFDPQAANTIGVKVNETLFENPESNTNAQTEDAIDLTWELTGASAATAADIVLQYPGAVELTNYTRADGQVIFWEDGTSTAWSATSSTTNAGSDPYTATSSEDFNAGTYYLSAADNESPLLGIAVSVSLFLEGPFNGTDMNNDLGTGGTSSILAQNALSQPYNTAPWNYAGSESVAASFFATNTDIVDWVLVELRDPTDPTIIVESAAVLLKTDGTTIDPSGATAKFEAASGSYHVAIRHRNHADIRTATPIDGSTGVINFDVRTSAANVFGTTNLKAVGSNFVMYAGDETAENVINTSDFNEISNNFTLVGYIGADLNMDGAVNTSDFNPISNNFTLAINF